jgi:hypothetical protein
MEIGAKLCQPRLQSLRKLMLLKGYGLQAVRKCLVINPALAAEGPFPS